MSVSCVDRDIETKTRFVNWLSSRNHKEREVNMRIKYPENVGGKVGSGVFVVLGIGSGIWLSLILADLLTFLYLYWSSTNVLQNYGMAEYGAKLTAVLFAAIVAYLANNMLWNMIKRNNKKWVPVLAGTMALWFVIMYVVASPYANSLFNPFSGKAQAKYYTTSDGIIVKMPMGARTGPEGQKLEVFDPATAEKYTEQEAGENGTSREISNSTTGKIRVYSRDPSDNLETWFEKIQLSSRGTTLYMVSKGRDGNILYALMNGHASKPGYISRDSQMYLADDAGRIYDRIRSDIWGRAVRAGEIHRYTYTFQPLSGKVNQLRLHHDELSNSVVDLTSLLVRAELVDEEPKQNIRSPSPAKEGIQVRTEPAWISVQPLQVVPLPQPLELSEFVGRWKGYHIVYHMLLDHVSSKTVGEIQVEQNEPAADVFIARENDKLRVRVFGSEQDQEFLMSYRDGKIRVPGEARNFYKGAIPTLELLSNGSPMISTGVMSLVLRPCDKTVPGCSPESVSDRNSAVAKAEQIPPLTQPENQVVVTEPTRVSRTQVTSKTTQSADEAPTLSSRERSRYFPLKLPPAVVFSRPSVTPIPSLIALVNPTVCQVRGPQDSEWMRSRLSGRPELLVDKMEVKKDEIQLYICARSNRLLPVHNLSDAEVFESYLADDKDRIYEFRTGSNMFTVSEDRVTVEPYLPYVDSFFLLVPGELYVFRMNFKVLEDDVDELTLHRRDYSPMKLDRQLKSVRSSLR